MTVHLGQEAEDTRTERDFTEKPETETQRAAAASQLRSWEKGQHRMLALRWPGSPSLLKILASARQPQALPHWEFTETCVRTHIFFFT